MAGNNNTPGKGQREACKSCGKMKGPTKKVKELWIGCEACSEWFHTDCEKITDTQYKVINEMGGSLKWKCKKCNETEKDVRRCNMKGDHTDMVEELKKMFSCLLDNKLTDMEDKLKRVINQELDMRMTKEEEKRKIESEELHTRLEKLENGRELEKKAENNGKRQLEMRKELNETGDYRDPRELRKQINNEIREIRERQERRKNIIIVGLDEEIPMDTGMEGKKWLQETLELKTELDIIDCYRLGKKEGKVRPIKIDFKTEEQAKEILAKRKTMISRENGKYRKVYINPDRTRTQREEQKVWREKKRNGMNSTEQKARRDTEKGQTITEEEDSTEISEEKAAKQNN